jgi:hypothetical protein
LHMIYKLSSSRMKEAIRGFWASADSAGKKLSFALVIGLLVCCLLPAIILTAGVGITSYFILRESDILTFSAFIIILISAVVIWTFRHRIRSYGTQAEMDLGKDQQQSERMGRAEEEQQTVRGKIGKDRCCEGDSKSD